MRYADRVDGESGSQLESELRARQRTAMQGAMEDVAAALQTLGRPDPFGPDIKASDDFLGPVFQKYSEKLGLPNLMNKTDYHLLAALVPKALIDSEIGEKLDRIVQVASRAKPVI